VKGQVFYVVFWLGMLLAAILNFGKCLEKVFVSRLCEDSPVLQLF